MTNAPLPIDDALPALLDALRASGRAVLQAPPGAGKTTRVPLAMLEGGLGPDRIAMLEPRRLAARSAAARMAETLGQDVGATVGYRMRGDTKVSKATRIEVVTEGILTRMLQTDPSLEGIAWLIFDEFHERSLNADLGLALAWEARQALRPDLGILVMSATLDAEPVAAMLDAAPVVTSQGQSFPVETVWQDAPAKKGVWLEDRVADQVLAALPVTQGDVLVFLPGAREIHGVENRLKGRVSGVAIHPLFGAMPFKAQRAAIAAGQDRKVVLATSIAETSLTIEGVRVVVDAGLARRARYDPGSGMTRLVTERASRAEADQRRGRAGRVAPGICFRMWTKGEAGAMPEFAPAEIETADLAGLALDLAAWGTDSTDQMAFLTPPPSGAWEQAHDLLTSLRALEGAGRITDHGRALAALPLHPRLGHMLTLAGAGAADLAAILSERDPLTHAPVDLSLRLEAVRDTRAYAARHPWPANPGAVAQIRDTAKRLRKAAPQAKAPPLSVQAALAYPDRIGLRRPGDDPRWLLSGGKGVAMAPDDPLAGARLIVVTDTDGRARDARVRQAVTLPEADLRDAFADQIAWRDTCRWSRRTGRVEAVQEERFGALVLNARRWDDAPAEDVTTAMLDGVRDLGLGLSAKAKRFQERVEGARVGGAALPDCSDAALLDTLEDWLAPFLGGVRSAADWRAFDATEALAARLDHAQTQALNRAAPRRFETPLGRGVEVDYSGDAPEIAVKLQEMFGTTTHPVVAGQPLRITLLSPAGRPLQTTTDLPGFWRGAYGDVRKDMRGRYPKHPWPEEPWKAAPTARAKPRG